MSSPAAVVGSSRGSGLTQVGTATAEGRPQQPAAEQAVRGKEEEGTSTEEVEVVDGVGTTSLYVEGGGVTEAAEEAAVAEATAA